jgi:hypothetical protein
MILTEERRSGFVVLYTWFNDTRWRSFGIERRIFSYVWARDIDGKSWGR